MEANRTRTQVHMLPTLDKSTICVDNSNNKIEIADFDYSTGISYTNQHLYFTTDEEIKDGDWFIHPDATIPQNDFSHVYVDCRKIIASETSDEVFHNTYKQKLPQPSQAFIKAYCEQGGIDWVNVEGVFIRFPLKERMGIKGIHFEPKVDPVHNTITTHRIVEKMYSREDLENLMMQSYIYGQSDKTDSFHKRESTIEKLIKENL